MFPHCKVLTVGLMDSSCDLCLVTSKATAGFSLLVVLIKLTETSAETPSLIKPMCCSLELATLCCQQRQNNWWYQLWSAYRLTIALSHFTALQDGKVQRMSSST